MNGRAPWRRTGGGALLFIRVSANASADALDGVRPGPDGVCVLEVRVRAVAEKGRANEAAERLIAGALGLNRGAVQVESGRASRFKRVRISADGSIEERLLRLTGAADAG